ncbi:hypothetical protein [Jannaschia donghaensis]|uniref:Flp pilus assembly protein, pilin Flp n=1 Tax=Jannaschia donghaensis TaxID=420998 RepID=A0A0M6YMD7_9RHOB|nr:hypothetical protein [Jannaschia donghaensis]CTQ51100.1 hypothetical protein JDO7802_03138 [Jannaschia donghaensis]
MLAISSFLHAEDGAVTVDWVVLTATLVGLGLGVAILLGEGFRTSSTELQVELSRNDIICFDFCDRFASAEDPEAEPTVNP